MKFKGTKQEITKKISELKEDKVYICIVSEKETIEIRSKEQNDMFYGLFSEIGKHLGENTNDVKQNFLKGLFGVKKSTLGVFESELAIEPETSKLSREKAIKLINGIIAFIEKYGVPCKYTSRDFQNLIDTY